MIKKLSRNIAAEMGIKLSRITLKDGAPLSCTDAHVLDMTARGKTVSALVSRSDIDRLQSGGDVDTLAVKVRSALSRLKLLLEA